LKVIKVIIDRFEGDYAIVELPEKTMVNMPKKLIPQGAREGNVISIQIDTDETTARKKNIDKLIDEVWEK
jgi:hypothetical protein